MKKMQSVNRASLPDKKCENHWKINNFTLYNLAKIVPKNADGLKKRACISREDDVQYKSENDKGRFKKKERTNARTRGTCPCGLFRTQICFYPGFGIEK